MEPLNYCRQILTQYKKLMTNPNMDKDIHQQLLTTIAAIEDSKKFILPDNAQIIDDKECRALDENAELNLPYKRIVLEYYCREENIANLCSAPKRVVIAIDSGDEILVSYVVCVQANGIWVPAPWIFIEKRNAVHEIANGTRRFSFRQFVREDYSRIEMSDYNDELNALFGFLNALACSNVHQEKHSNRKKTAKKCKPCLPFDDYHILTIDAPGRNTGIGVFNSEGRRPREHLRRGHIRRLLDCRRIWVNAAVINAGIGNKVEKDYRVRGVTTH